MTYDSVILAAVASELNAQLVNGRIDKIHQPTPLDLVLGIRAGGANYSLLISADAQFPRVHLTSVKRENPKTPPNFVMLLRKHLEGARLIGVEQVDFDRILHIKFSAFDGEVLTLIVEIMGKHSNIVLVNGTWRILGAIKPVGRSKNRYREVLPGRDYVAPPPQNRVNPLSTDKQEFAGLLADSFADAPPASDDEAAKWLTKTFTGISPFVAREIVARASRDGSDLSDAFESFFDGVRNDAFTPVLITDDQGHTEAFYPFPSAQYPAENQHERRSVNAVADVFYNTAVPKQEFAHTKESIVTGLRHAIESKERTLRQVEESIAETVNAERFKQVGELILSQPQAVADGASEATLVDYYDPAGASITVPLEPTLNRAENAEAYFRRYHKAVSGADALRDRLRETQAEIKLLQAFLDSAEKAESSEDVNELAKELEARGIYVRPQEIRQAARQKPAFDGYRIRQIESNGWEILIGENSEANDYLLTRVARPNDVWVHVKASPSAHVVIRTNNKPEAVPQSVLYAAAEQAAKHSDAKHSSLVPVDYTLRKYVRKPKGAPPGKAIYTHEKTVYITP